MADKPKEVKPKEPEVIEEGLSLKGSEFITNQDVLLHHKDLVPCTDDSIGAKEIRLNKGDKVPEIFVPNLLEHNRNYLGHYQEIDGKKVFIMKFPEKNGLPYITPEQEKKYKVSFKEKKPTRPKLKYNSEGLSRKWKELGHKGFKEWTEKEFGADKIDRRKSPRQIINEILSWF